MLQSHIRVASASVSCTRRDASHSTGRHGAHKCASRTTSSARFSGNRPVKSSNACASSARIKPPSYLYRSFMGHSTRFAAMKPPLTRAGITQLEREPLTHSTPGRINDHICIFMVKMLRWLANRAFRERYIHRATMLVTVAAAAPAAGSVAGYLRMFLKRRSSGITCAGGAKTPITAKASSPFLALGKPKSADTAPSAPGACRSFATARLSLHTSAGSAAMEGTRAALEHSYVDELRGLLAQCESHTIHYQVLSSMADITPAERALVLLLQALHFTVYLVLFLFYPRMGFRLMAYTAEESSVVWTQMVNDYDLGKIVERPVPQLAMHYWGLDGVFTAQAPLVPMAAASQKEEMVLYKPSERRVAERIPVANALSSADAGSQGATSPLSAFDCASGPPTAPAPLDDRAVEATENEGRAIPSSELETGSSAYVLTLRDVALLIRSDEMVFRDLNHEWADELDTQPSWLRRLVRSRGAEK
ncbi:hypothetical protein GH5_00482 [Leishmania sp. Ghana 2012 LV757]|uniref:hypothetical protein n=1 Tax=Leishmania sp. Ghana 2012 LV757 TaxID=2803181 RepID=UPI001B497304|nr:hypothetical protein GH5_00482 [Leishmania sp. Ghana 2012 LV757]